MTEKVQQGNRIKWIDAIKGFAIILVVFAHTAERYYKFDLYPEYTQIFRILYEIIYSFHMPLFIVISGYLFQLSYLTPSWEKKKSRFWKHWINLAIVYTLFSIGLGGVKLVFSKDIIHPITWHDTFLVWFKPIGHMWYLYVLLQLNLLFANKRIRAISTRIKVCLTMTLSLLSTFILSSWFDIQHLSKYAFFFLIGTLIVDNEIFLWKRGVSFALGAIALIALASTLAFGLEPQFTFAIHMITGVGLSFIFIWLFKNINMLDNIKMFSTLSSYSLEIYILHQYPVVALTKIIRKLDLNIIFGFFCTFALSIIMVILVIEMLKKIQIYKLLFKPYDFIKSIRNYEER